MAALRCCASHASLLRQHRGASAAARCISTFHGETGQSELRIRVRSFEVRTVEKFGVFLANSLKGARLRGGEAPSVVPDMRGPLPLPLKRERFTLNKAHNINKTSREQFEIVTHSRLWTVTFPGPVEDVVVGDDFEYDVEGHTFRADQVALPDFRGGAWLDLLHDGQPEGVGVSWRLLTRKAVDLEAGTAVWTGAPPAVRCFNCGGEHALSVCPEPMSKARLRVGYEADRAYGGTQKRRSFFATASDSAVRKYTNEMRAPRRSSKHGVGHQSRKRRGRRRRAAEAAGAPAGAPSAEASAVCTADE